MDQALSLLDYRRRSSDLYAEVRRSDLDVAGRCHKFLAGREHLFKTHPQSPLSEKQKAHFQPPDYFAFDPALRFVLPVDTAVEPQTFNLELRDDGLVRMRRFGRIRFALDGQQVDLSLFWILGYGGGLFLPFRDVTNSRETYGGGRYLLDTIKHADFGQQDDRLVIDFNYAYNPSCAYNAQWHCPLAPVENRLPVGIRAGEEAYPGPE